MKNNKGSKNFIKKSLNSKDNIVNQNDDSNIYSLENNEMLDNLIKISGNQDVYKELKDETSKIKELLSQSKEKLNNINLFEKQKPDIDIYQWNNLFNQSIPITSYVSSSKTIKKQNEKKEESKKEIENKENEKNIKHPVALVDLTEEEIKKYLPPNPVGIPPSSVVRFQQLPFKGNSKDSFYFSNAFNDYYKMDFKEFIKIMPVLKAKKRCESARLASQVKKVKQKNAEEEQKREKMKNQMSDQLNNLYIEKQYLSLSVNANNIQPLMSSIHAQIYPGEGDELTKHTKIYTKTDKPLGSERNVDCIDYTVNERDYHRNELMKLKFNKKRAKAPVRKLFLSRYDINDPDVAVFKRIEILEKIISEGDKFYGNQYLIDEKEEKSIINCEGESKKEEDNSNINNIKDDKTNKSEFSSQKEENEIQKTNNKSTNYKFVNAEKQVSKFRAASAKREYSRKDEITNINNTNKKFPRAMSAHQINPLEKNELYIHNVYLSSRNKFGIQKAFYYNNKRAQRNKLNELLDENKKVNTSSQISTYEGINNSIYEKQNNSRYGFPFKNNHQIENKMYLKINKRLKEKQYEKYQKKLEEFSKLIHLDDAFLSEDILKEKNNNSNINKYSNNVNNELFYIDKNKIFKRPYSSYLNKSESIKKEKNSKINLKPPTPKLFRLNRTNNFRAVSKKSSNENSKIEFTTSVLTNKHEYFLNNKNDKVTLVYFNDIIEMKPQNINEMKPIIKNDGIIVPSNYFNRGKPQFLNNHKKSNNIRKNFNRIHSGKTLGSIPKLKDNIIIQDEHFKTYKKKFKDRNNIRKNGEIKKKRNFSIKK